MSLRRWKFFIGPSSAGRSLRELGLRATGRGRPVGLLRCCAAIANVNSCYKRIYTHRLNRSVCAVFLAAGLAWITPVTAQPPSHGGAPGRSIPESDVPILPAPFARQGLTHAHTLTQRAQSIIFTSLWTPAEALFPRTEMVYSRAEKGFEFSRAPAPLQILELFDFLKQRDNRLGLAQTAPTSWAGDIAYLPFKSDGAACVAYSHSWTGGSIGGGAQLLGYSCDDGNRLSDDGAIRAFLNRFDMRVDPPVSITLTETDRTLPIIVTWPSDPVGTGRGRMILERIGGGSLIFSVGERRCEGFWHHQAGSYGESDPPSGLWRAFCNDTTAIEGTYFSSDPQSARATGYDGQGNAVFFELDLP